MTSDDIRNICISLPNATEDIKWGHDLCFCISGKMFFVIATDKVPVSASFKTDEESFNELTERDGFIPAPYMARHKWVYVDDIGRVSKKEWQQFIQQSYEMVKAKLPIKKK
jgi:predicted DNA-binding protein (MmcQ/YjbR family)